MAFKLVFQVLKLGFCIHLSDALSNDQPILRKQSISYHSRHYKLEVMPTGSVVSEYNICAVEVHGFIVVLHCRLKIFLLICCVAQILLCYSLHPQMHLHSTILLMLLLISE